MPLPPTLLARLKKRGIIKQDDSGDPNEEIIAEDYSDVNPGFYQQHASASAGSDDSDESDEEEMEGGCPNRWNKWHTCSKFCDERWGEPRKKQPKTASGEELPPGWVKTIDDNTAQPYYWNTITDQVSWLPPTDPNAKITLPASKLQQEDDESLSDDATNGDTMDEDLHPPGTEPVIHESCWKCGKKINNISGICRTCEMDGTGGGPTREKRRFHESRKESTPYQKSHKGQRRFQDDLDPMDPSAYSDTPRGTWSSGMVSKGEAKTGVDTTANGPLFQQRPYPSPGEILRQNKARHDPDDSQ
ncbi:polyglutamine-binding protein 1-like [Ptychodera flava]|uniref:polyglutamine-binding protein 1-like n=1 Tax=Ptychodera flava TaxID=63121 RepID=UPI00396AAFA2